MYKVARKTFSDGPAKTVYASLLNEGAVAMPALLPKSTFTAVTAVPQEGWALKVTKNLIVSMKNREATLRQNSALAKQQVENSMQKSLL